MPKRASLPEGKSLFFRRPADESETAVTEGPVALPEKGPTRQSAIFLEDRHLDWLDDKCREARKRGGRAIRKAVIIRSLLDVAIDSKIDLTSLRDETELTERIRKGLRASEPRSDATGETGGGPTDGTGRT